MKDILLGVVASNVTFRFETKETAIELVFFELETLDVMGRKLFTIDYIIKDRVKLNSSLNQWLLWSGVNLELKRSGAKLPQELFSDYINVDADFTPAKLNVKL